MGESAAEREGSAGDGEIVKAVDLSTEEWGVVRALRQLHEKGRPVREPAPANGLQDHEALVTLLEDEVFENVAATLDRMLERADRTSRDLDGLLARLSETTPHRSPAA